jgi:hypothetical protein
MSIFSKSSGLIIGTFFSLGLLSCSAGQDIYGYASPIITGQVLDKTTNKPIENVSLLQTSADTTMTDHNGYFRLPSYKEDYTTSDTGRGINLMTEGGFDLYKEGYRRKVFSNSGFKFLEVKYTEEVPYHIHLGKVFLEPLPEGVDMNDIEDEYIDDMTFCQPNDSQKDVNCMPLPDGVTNEAL